MFNFIAKQIKKPGKGMITALSVILSFTLWAMIKLNENYTTTLNLPCKIIHIPKDLRLESTIIPEISFRVRGKGSDLFWEYWKWHKDTLAIKYQNDINKGFLNLANRQNAFIHFPQELQIITILEDSLTIKPLQTASFKKVPVKAYVKTNLAEGYAIFSSPTLSPDSVIIYGNKADLAKITECKTEAVEIFDIKDSIIQQLYIKTNSVFTVSNSKITYKTYAQKYTEIEPEVKIVINDAPYDTKIKFYPEILRPHCKIPLSQYEKWINQSWIWYIPYQNISKESILIPNFSFFPAEVQVIPPYLLPVHFIIQHRQ